MFSGVNLITLNGLFTFWILEMYIITRVRFRITKSENYCPCNGLLPAPLLYFWQQPTTIFFLIQLIIELWLINYPIMGSEVLPWSGLEAISQIGNNLFLWIRLIPVYKLSCVVYHKNPFLFISYINDFRYSSSVLSLFFFCWWFYCIYFSQKSLNSIRNGEFWIEEYYLVNSC